MKIHTKEPAWNWGETPIPKDDLLQIISSGQGHRKGQVTNHQLTLPNKHSIYNQPSGTPPGHPKGHLLETDIEQL
ncbi:Hypothetical protein FKW44_022773 [Caligus rogercresseyi]|uniref:Uncharacterized protein n=1 Tax=Caligus rogercresseyi TaxID=217165 RepID=A0A7T8GMZ5_CALRO|nr:Hypothetical protein FKW44_022773 [Caligus rogercresseyi]